LNKLEAGVSLVIITFFAGVQYPFLSGVVASVSVFAFLTVTNFIGFLIILAAFWGELFRLTKKQALQSGLLAAEMLMFNIFSLLGSSGMDPSVTSFALTGYLLFIPLLYFLLRKKVHRRALIGTGAVLAGLLLALEADPARLWDARILLLLIAGFFFALYMVTVEKLCVNANPSILSMGRMFFGFVSALACWTAEILITGGGFTVPDAPGFWNSVIFISVFICGFYCVVQIYAQRYLSAMDAGLIFSTEVIFTLLASPLLVRVTGGTAEPITGFKLAGCAIIVAGVLIAGGVKRGAHEK
jgi:drug/metabolite transporter (DMT)-like permease